MKSINLSGTVKDVSIGVAGASFAQAISFLLVPVVARLFSPDDFGAAAIFLGFFSIISSVSTMRYEQAILLPRAEKDAMKVTWLSLYVLVVSVVLSVILLIFLNLYLKDSSDSLIEWYWYFLMPIFLLVSGLVNVAQSWGTRLKFFGLMATADASSTLVVSGTRISIGFVLGSTVSGLLIGNLFGHLLRLVLMSKNKIGTNIIEGRKLVSKSDLTENMKKYYDFPVYMAPTGFIRELKENMPLFFITLIFSTQIVGFYAMAYRLLRLPVSVVSLPVRRVFVQKASVLIHENKIEVRDLLLKFSLFLFIVGLIPFVLINSYAEDIFLIVLGDQWKVAGIYAEVMSFWLFSVFVLTPSAAIFMVVRKQNIWLIFQIIGVVVSAGVFVGSSHYSLSVLTTLSHFTNVHIFLNVMVFITAIYLTSTNKIEALVSDSK